MTNARDCRVLATQVKTGREKTLHRLELRGRAESHLDEWSAGHVQ